MTEHQVTYTRIVSESLYPKSVLQWAPSSNLIRVGSKCSVIFAINKYYSIQIDGNRTFYTLRPRQGYQNGVKWKTVKIETNDSLQLRNIHTIEWEKKPPHNRNRKINSANYVHLMFKLMSCIDDEAAETRWQWKL